jgi:predicted kinase
MTGARLILICGLPGSGKTTLAKELAPKVPAIRLCPDEWKHDLGIDYYDEQRRVQLEARLWRLGQELLTLGQSVILENGFWAREERDELRLGARPLAWQWSCTTWSAGRGAVAAAAASERRSPSRRGADRARRSSAVGTRVRSPRRGGARSVRRRLSVIELPRDLPILERDAVRLVVRDSEDRILLFHTHEVTLP